MSGASWKTVLSTQEFHSLKAVIGGDRGEFTRVGIIDTMDTVVPQTPTTSRAPDRRVIEERGRKSWTLSSPRC